MIREEWDRMFLNLMPVVSTGLASLSIVLGIMTLLRASPLGQRVYYQDGQYLVAVRYPGQWHDIRSFVQPDNTDVVAICSQIGPDVWQCLDFVCRYVAYKRELGEMWQFPSETLARGEGDCEDTSILLTSLVRAGGAPNCYVAVGSLGGYGHAWSEIDGQVLETTFTSARVVPDPAQYYPYIYFNDTEVIELWPGALGEVFELKRDEATKLNLMAKAVG